MGVVMDHVDLVLRAEKWLKQIGCGVVFNDRFQASVSTGERPDAIGWRSGVSFVVECKVSRADFLADKRKRFRIDPSQGMGDWRLILCPLELIHPSEVPDGWGLLWATEKTVQRIHGVPPGNAHWMQKKPFMGNKDAEMVVMYSALRRMAISGHLDEVYTPVTDRKRNPLL